MIYVMSDLHGEYAKYLEMLEKIRFCDDDTLYILGDAVDRGPDPIPLLQDMMARENVYFLMGNHEGMALHVLEKLNVEVTAENAENHLNAEWMGRIMEWQQNGGDVTMRQFRRLSADERQDVLDYLRDAPMYDVAEAGGKTFVLVHAGLGHFRKGKKLREYTFEEMTCMRPDFERQCFDDPDVYVVCGHTPTLSVTGRPEMYVSGNNWLIDCGVAYGGRLCCVCLDNGKQYYV